MEDYKKKYENALEWARNLYNSKHADINLRLTLEDVFPELRESEDERIRKELLEYFKLKLKCCPLTDKQEELINKGIIWLEKQGEQSIYDVPSRNMILSVWELGNEWKELTNGSISKEYGTQLEYIQKHWNESQYYLRDKQGKQKPIEWNADDLLKRNQIITILKEYNRTDLIAWLEKQGHDGKKWIYEDAYIKEKEQVFQDGIDEVLENPQRYGLEKQGEQKLLNNDKYQTVSVKILDRLYESEKELERLKQGEQKPADKVESRFKVGDWIISSEGTLRHIVDVDKTGYQTDKGWLTHAFYENTYHLWTIQDAKDGDVLALNGEVFIYAHRKQLYSIAIAHCFVDSAGGFYFDGEFGYTEKRNSIHPATKEQRNLLFTKMKEAGYEWDAEKKELKKIEQKSVHADYISGIREELLSIEDNIENINGLTESQWVAIRAAHRLLGEYMVKEQKPTWSEEDSYMLGQAIKCVNNSGKLDVSTEEIEDWLKSLKERCTWKPSGEQMEAVRIAAEIGVANNSWAMDVLKSMYQDLKKLKGE